MIQLMPAEPGAYRVVDVHDLYDLTRRGWHLVALLTEEEVQKVQELLPPEHLAVAKERDRYSGHHGSGTHWDKPILKQVQKYLVRQVKDDLLAALHEDIKKLQRERGDSQSAARVAEQKLEEEQKLRAEAEEQLAAERKLKDSLYHQLEGNQTTRQKLERDIAKLRTAIGDLRMKEILDG